MAKNITIIDPEYLHWVKDLCQRYRNLQIKAAVKVNQYMLQFYWELGRDIANRQEENRYGSAFYPTLSRDLKHEMPGVEGLSETSIRYAKRFYRLYNKWIEDLEQLINKSSTNESQAEEELTTRILPQLGEELKNRIFSVPWGHHKLLIDKFSDIPHIALFYINETIKNGWSRMALQSSIDTNLHEREGKALTNFSDTLPSYTSDLAQELLRDPYHFAFTGVRGQYNEKILKDALLNHITEFLIELGTGFAYVGKEYRLKIDVKEKFIDLLFYNLNLSCYVVIEVKIGELDFGDIGQLSGYVVACNHLLRKEGRDNPTIGLLVCKQKNNLLAQYALESSSQPLGISSYELAKLYPENIEGTIPSIEEIEAKLKEIDDGKKTTK